VLCYEVKCFFFFILFYFSLFNLIFRGVALFAMVVGRLPFEVENKKPVSNQHRRKLFLEEMKRGIKTMKHQTYMGSASSRKSL
jgi:hypothetical protein